MPPDLNEHLTIYRRIVDVLITANPPDLTDLMVDLARLVANASMYDASRLGLEELAAEFRRQLGRD